MQRHEKYEEVLKELFSLRASQHIRPDLGPMQEAAKVFEHPEKELEFIHITGTNGKGSTAAFLTEILICEGKKVGTYTSPFLTDYRERITINNNFIPKEKVVQYYTLIQEKTHTQNIELSFFEISTLMALLYFKEEGVDYVVWEVGMGGSFDATKIAHANISAITNVSLDHTNVLGRTKEKIARDKCGIIVEDAHVFSAEEDEKIRDIIREACKNKSAKLTFTKESTEETLLGLQGSHQRKNAGIAIAIANHLGIDEENILKGLAQTKWPGRLEYIDKNILLDCAHNPAGMKSLAKYITSRKEKKKFEKLYIIFGASADKDIEKMIRLLPEHEELIFTEADYFRAQHVEEISQINNKTCTKIPHSEDALIYAERKAEEKDLILICGSIFLVGEIMNTYKKRTVEVCPYTKNE